jgi:hypothetical protein
MTEERIAKEVRVSGRATLDDGISGESKEETEMRVLKNTNLVIVGMIALFAVGILVSPSYAEIDPGTIVGIWLFNEGKGNVARDSSGNGRNGEVLADVKWVKGMFDDALMFPGKKTDTSYVRVPNNPSLDLSEHSITAWIKVTPTEGDWQVIVGKWEPHELRNYSLLTYLDTGIFFAQFTSGGEGQYKTALGKTVVTDGEWHHVACTYDGAVLKAYVDGIMEGQVAATEPDLTPGDLTIGARWAGIHPTTGIIDDVGLFRVALEEDEIKEIMDNGLRASLQLTAIEPVGKLAATWGQIKTSR